MQLKRRSTLFVKHSTANIILAFTQQRKNIHSCRKSHSHRTSIVDNHNKLKQRDIAKCGVQTSTDKTKKSHEKELQRSLRDKESKANEISARSKSLRRRFATVLCNENNDTNGFLIYADAFLIANTISSFKSNL